MARFNCSGLDEFALSMQEIEEIPEEVKGEMLSAGADVAISAMKQNIAALGVVDSHQLMNSLTKKKKKGKNGDLYYVVAPQGKRSDGERNGTVGYVNEFGAPHRGIRPRPWMQTALYESADAIVAAEFAVYDKWLKSKNL